jgi:hypothetical protein
LQKKRKKNKTELSVPMGCASIHLRGGRASGYNPIALTKSNKGWHKLWFYLKNDIAAPLPVFSGRLIEEVPPECRYFPVEKEKRRLHDLLNVITQLRSGGVHGVCVIGAYHARGVAPLMAHALSLYEMAPNAPLKGTVLARGPYRNSDIEQRIREATDVLDDTFRFPIPGHPVMRPGCGLH